MNFFNWLGGWKKDSNDDSQLDFSFLFPATIGVGSIVICLVARYRNELFDLKSTVFRNTKDENVSSRRGNSSSNFKKKPKHSNKSESNTPHIRKTEVSQPLVVETLAPVVPVQQKEYTSVQPIQIKQETVSEATDGIEAEFFNPIPKRQKKSKRSSKTKDTQNHGLSEQTEIDPAWVTVTSKKVKLSSRNTQKKKNVDSEGDQSVSENHSPISVAESPIQNKQANNKQQELSTSNKSSSSIVENKSMNSESNTDQSCPTKRSKAPAQTQSTKIEHNENTKLGTVNSHNSTPYEELLYKNLGAETVTAIRSLILNSETHTSRPSEIPPSCGEVNKQKISSVAPKSTDHLPTTSELLSQHMTAQLQAKEAECQVLRTEVVHLRDEVKILKTLAVNRVPVQKPMTDAETMTDPIESPDIKSSFPQQSTDSDAILLSTLQNEIARLVKEVVIYQQRSENLKSRLDTANKKLSDSKSKAADETKLLQQTVDTQSEKLYNLESENSRLEKELKDVLQKAEIHHRKSEEADHILTQRLEELEVLRLENSSFRSKCEALENGNSVLREEKDILTRKFDELSNKHSSILSELTASQSQCNVLRRQMTGYDDRLRQINDQHQIVVDDMKNQLTSLLCNHETKEKSHINMINTLEAKLEQLTNENNELNKLLKLCESELEHLRTAQKVTVIQRTNEDKFMQTVDDIQNNDSSQIDDGKSSSINHETIVQMNDHTDQTESDQFIVESSEYKLLQNQIDHYKSALDATESMLSKLQTSVDEEEARWHKALDAANIENELLKTKSIKLEAALNELIEDRNTLTMTIEELRKNSQFNDCNLVATLTDNSLTTTISTEKKLNKSSSTSPSPSSPLSTTATTTDDTDEQNMSKSELIRLVAKLRSLVEVERNALKQEQSLSAELRTKLNDADSHDDQNCNYSNNNCSDENPCLINSRTETTDDAINHNNTGDDHYTNMKTNSLHNHSKDGILETADVKSEHLNNCFDVKSKVPDCIPPHEISSNDNGYILLSNGINKELNGQPNHDQIDSNNVDDNN
uniref:TMF_TATA_bd domain-containing protein n=1 Tax=Schistosoma mansoni TaxID=6183 RepID=A0A3Q0KU06_SCHMA